MCAIKKVGMEQLLTVYAKRRIRCHQPQLPKATIWCLAQWMDIWGTPHLWMLCLPKAEVALRGPGRALRERESHCRLLTRQTKRSWVSPWALLGAGSSQVSPAFGWRVAPAGALLLPHGGHAAQRGSPHRGWAQREQTGPYTLRETAWVWGQLLPLVSSCFFIGRGCGRAPERPVCVETATNMGREDIGMLLRPYFRFQKHVSAQENRV